MNLNHETQFCLDFITFGLVLANFAIRNLNQHAIKNWYKYYQPFNMINHCM